MSNIIRAYFNQKAAIWDETVAEKDAAKLRRMAKRLNIKPGSTVLDVGTGTGVFLPFILDEIGPDGRIIAIDCAEEMLRKGRAKGFTRDIDYLHADVANIPLRDNVFDVVVCYSSFPHFRDKPLSLAEINRVIRSGGKLVICHTSSRTKINEIHRHIPAVEKDTIPDKSQMRAMLLGAGFADIEIADRSTNYLVSARKPGKKTA